MEDYKIIIELDGLQHFKQVSNWADPETTRKKDIYKMNQAIKNGYTIVRLLQDDIWKDKISWKKELKKYLYIQKKPCIIYICENDEYDDFINE